MGRGESNRDTSNLLRDRPMRPGRVNTYHNDPFVAAAANNAFVIAPFSLFLPPAVPRCSSYRVISESLFHPCVYLPGLCPASIFWTDLWRFASETRFRLGDLDNFPSRHGTRRKKIELNADSCSRLSWDLREEISKFARVLRSYDVLNMEKLAYWKKACVEISKVLIIESVGELTYSFHLFIGRSR